MPMIHLIAPGQRVAAFAIDGATVTIGGLTIDCASEQRDEAVTLEVRQGPSGPMLGGDGAYIATIHIPARQYAEQASGETDPMTGEPRTERVALPLDPDAVAITLWPTV